MLGELCSCRTMLSLARWSQRSRRSEHGTNQADKRFGERDRLVQRRGAPRRSASNARPASLRFSVRRSTSHAPGRGVGTRRGAALNIPVGMAILRIASPAADHKVSLCRAQTLEIARERGVAAPVAVFLHTRGTIIGRCGGRRSNDRARPSAAVDLAVSGVPAALALRKDFVRR